MEGSMIAEAQSRLDDVQAVPLVPWVGGKRRLAPHILPLLPAHTCYVEPFAGAAGLFFSKPPSKVEVLNDVNGDLVCLYRVVQHHLDEFMRQFRWSLTSRQMYAWLRETKPDTLTDIQRAARFFYLQKLAFGGKVDGQTYGTSTTAPMRLNLLRLEEDLSAATCGCTRSTSRTWTGTPASRATTASTPCSSATRRTTAPRATASSSAWSSTTAWPSCCAR